MAKKINRRIVDILNSSGVGCIASDTIYGLSCKALDEIAVNKLLKIKGDRSGKAFIVLISNVDMLNKLSIPIDQVKSVSKYWPGAITIECDASRSASWLPKIDGHFGVRMPDKPDLLNLISQVGPLVSTSANRSGERPARSVAEVKAIFGDELDFYVDEGPIDQPPSTLVRDNGSSLEIIREGAVKIK